MKFLTVCLCISALINASNTAQCYSTAILTQVTEVSEFKLIKTDVCTAAQLQISLKLQMEFPLHR